MLWLFHIHQSGSTELFLPIQDRHVAQSNQDIAVRKPDVPYADDEHVYKAGPIPLEYVHLLYQAEKHVPCIR